MDLKRTLKLMHPRFWLMNCQYDASWDKFVKNNIHTLCDIDNYTGKIGGKEIWLANYPYGYGQPYPPLRVRPSRSTILRLRQQHLKVALGIENET